MPEKNLMLLVNSRQADRVRVQVSSGKLVDCQPIGEALGLTGIGARTYDSVCRIVLGEACASETPVTIALYDASSLRTPIELRVRAPC